jgi:hypothetical protein
VRSCRIVTPAWRALRDKTVGSIYDELVHLKASLIALLAGSTGCTSVQVRKYELAASPPPKPANCRMDFVRWPVPRGSIVRLAVLENRDPNGLLAADRSGVEMELSEKACALGADAVLMDREEYARPYVGTDVTATAFIYRTLPGSQTPSQPPNTCTPPCSPGYTCEGTLCVPSCNPACIPPQSCGSDRVCR